MTCAVLPRNLCGISRRVQGDVSSRDGPDLLRYLWALVVSNHRPPPCKGAPGQALYLLKRAKALLNVPIRSARVGTDWHPPAYVVLPFCLLGFAPVRMRSVRRGPGWSGNSMQLNPGPIPPFEDDHRDPPAGSLLLGRESQHHALLASPDPLALLACRHTDPYGKDLRSGLDGGIRVGQQAVELVRVRRRSSLRSEDGPRAIPERLGMRAGQS